METAPGISPKKHLARIRGGLIITFFFLASVLLGKWTTTLMVLWLFSQGLKEYIKMAQKSGINYLPKYLLYILMAILYVSAIGGAAYLNYALIASVLVIVSHYVICKSLSKESALSISFDDVGKVSFMLIYLGWLPAHFVLLRMLNDGDFISSQFWISDQYLSQSVGLLAQGKIIELSSYLWGLIREPGNYYCLLTATAVFIADIAAYYVGKNFGKTKLTPLSPNKTLEGAIGGLIASVFFFAYLGGMAQSFFGVTPIPLPTMILCGIVIAAISQIGDIYESSLKRAANTKDSGQAIEGQGGVLDRFDSHIFIMVIAYYFFLWASNN